MIHQAVRIYGKLVEVETNERGYRTAFVLDGRHVVDASVGKRINGELDELVGQNIVAGCIYSTRWLDLADGKRQPAGRLTIVAVEADGPEPELAEAA